MSDEEKPTIAVTHTDEGVIIQVPIGPFTWVVVPLADATIGELYQERKRRKAGKIITIGGVVD